MKKDPKIEEFFAIENEEKVLIDVRSPSEYAKGHIPGAENVFLFSDEARAVIGTVYKKQGPRAAIEEGLSQVDLYAMAQKMKKFSEKKKIFVYCARGGMRSQSAGWLFKLLGYSVTILDGGYKNFRNWALLQFEKNYPLMVLGGKTGSGKTACLHELEKGGCAVLDLEGCAKHRGSVFGALLEKGPSQQQFENILALLLFQLRGKKPIWVEDESRWIGSLRIPEKFFFQMRKSSIVVLDVPLEVRMKRTCQEYAGSSSEDLKGAVLKLQKKLGLERVKEIFSFLEQKQYERCCEILFSYYDKKYEEDLAKRDGQTVLFEKVKNPEMVHLLLSKRYNKERS